MDNNSYSVFGNILKQDERNYIITELPLRTWTDNYKEFLDGLRKSENKNVSPVLSSYESSCTDLKIKFDIQF